MKAIVALFIFSIFSSNIVKAETKVVSAEILCSGRLEILFCATCSIAIRKAISYNKDKYEGYELDTKSIQSLVLWRGLNEDSGNLELAKACEAKMVKKDSSKISSSEDLVKDSVSSLGTIAKVERQVASSAINNSNHNFIKASEQEGNNSPVNAKDISK